MQPYYTDESVTLYHGDCREVDAWLEADVLICDPPYGRAWRQGDTEKARGWAPNAHAGIANDTDTSVRDEALGAWGDRPAVAFGDLMLTPPKGTRQVLVYAKPLDAGVRGATAGRRRDAEAIYLLGPWPSGIGGATSILRTAALVAGTTGLAARYEHPHAKPLDVMGELVGMTRGTIADPFAGGGSTLVAAKRLGRRAVGVELEERYCEVIAKRLSQGVLDFGETA